MTLKNEVMRGLKWTAGAKFGSQLITWGITIFVMRLLAPNDYGLLAMASVFLALLIMFAEAGLGPALVQTKEVDEHKLRSAFGAILLINIVLFTVVFFVAPLVAHFYDEPKLTLVIRVLSIPLLLNSFGVIPEVMLQRQLDFKKRSLIDLSCAVASSVATLAMAMAGWGVWALVLGGVFQSVWKTVVINFASPFIKLPRFSASGLRELVSFGSNVTGSRFLWFFFTQSDTVIIGRVLGGEVLGLYSVAMHLATLPMQRVSAILNQVAFPAFARYQHDRDLVAAQLLKALGMIGFFSFPVLWGMSSVSRELVAVVLGSGWDAAVLPLQILTLVMPFRTLVGFLPSITDALGRPDVGLKNVILGCITMPLAFYVGTRWGIAGVALAWVVVYPFVLLVNVHRMLGVVGLRMGLVARKIAPSVLSAAGMYGAVYGVQLACAALPDRRLALLAEIATGAVVYGLLMLKFQMVMVGELKSMMFSRKAG